MSAPKRIQRRRTKGWRMPEGAVYVGRPSRWGNPIDWTTYPAYQTHFADGELNDDPTRIADAERRRWAVIDFKDALIHGRLPYGIGVVRAYLRGRDLACWCPLEPCHADVLLEIANGGAS